MYLLIFFSFSAIASSLRAILRSLFSSRFSLISSFFSLAGATTIETGGLLTIVTVVAIYYVIKTFSDYRKGKGNKEIFILFLFSFVSLWGMVAAIALTGASNGKVRFVAYTRYFMPFIGPFLMVGLILLKKYKGDIVDGLGNVRNRPYFQFNNSAGCVCWHFLFIENDG